MPDQVADELEKLWGDHLLHLGYDLEEPGELAESTE
jgi:hypothetical protein